MNKVSRRIYVLILVVLEVCSAIVFQKLLPKYTLHVYRVKVPSYLLFSIIVIVTLAIGLLTSIKRERNIKSILLICGYPVLLYLDILYWRSITFWGVIIVSALLVITFANKINKDIGLATIADSDSYMNFRKRSRYIIARVSLIVILAGGAVLGYLNTTHTFENTVIPVLSQLQNEDVSDIKLPSYAKWNERDPEKMRSNRIKELAAFDDWAKCTKQQKEEALEALKDVEERYLGIPTKFKLVKVKELNQDVVYNEKEDRIYLNQKLYEGTDGYSVIKSLCYGLHQRYIHIEIDFYKKLYADARFKEYANLNLFNQLLLYNDKTEKEQKQKASCDYANDCSKSYKACIEDYKKQKK